MTHIKLSRSDTLINALDNFLCNPKGKSVIYQSITVGGVLDRINVVHIQAIAELVNTSSNLLLVNRDK